MLVVRSVLATCNVARKFLTLVHFYVHDRIDVGRPHRTLKVLYMYVTNVARRPRSMSAGRCVKTTNNSCIPGLKLAYPQMHVRRLHFISSDHCA